MVILPSCIHTCLYLGTHGAFSAANRKHRGVHNYTSRSHSHASGLLNQGGDTESPFNQLSVGHFKNSFHFVFDVTPEGL
jgi:hypothetical protein